MEMFCYFITLLCGVISVSNARDLREFMTPTTTTTTIPTSGDESSSSTAASNAPPHLGMNDLTNMLEKVFSLARQKKYGDVQRPDLPALGLCNKQTCAGLYDIFEKFRSSAFFANFNTFLSILGDKDGLKVLSDIMSDPSILNGLGGKGPAPKEGGGKPAEGDTSPQISESIDPSPYYHSGPDYGSLGGSGGSGAVERVETATNAGALHLSDLDRVPSTPGPQQTYTKTPYRKEDDPYYANYYQG